MLPWIVVEVEKVQGHIWRQWVTEPYASVKHSHSDLTERHLQRCRDALTLSDDTPVLGEVDGAVLGLQLVAPLLPVGSLLL